MSSSLTSQLGGSNPAAPNYVNPPNKATSGLTAAIVLLILAGLAVFLRLAAKVIDRQRQWRLHDAFALLGLVFATAEVIVTGVNVRHYGFGRHMKDIKPNNLDVVFRLLGQRYIMYELAIMFVKLSILHFYLTIFAVKKTFRIVTYVMMAVVVVYIVPFIFMDAFRCRPYKLMWYPITNSKKLTCIEGPKEQKGFGILNIFTDFVTLLLPFPLVLRLNMSRRKVFVVAMIFALGVFTCAAAIVRTVIIWRTFKTSSKDSTWTTADEVTWMNIEMLVGLICGSLLPTPALFRYLRDQTSIGRSLQSLLSRRSHERLSNDVEHTPHSHTRSSGPSERSETSLPFARGKSVPSYELSERVSSGSNSDDIPPVPTDGRIGVTKTVTVSHGA